MLLLCWSATIISTSYSYGMSLTGTKIVFTNGSQDPWRHASKQTSSPDCELPILALDALWLRLIKHRQTSNSNPLYANHAMNYFTLVFLTLKNSIHGLPLVQLYRLVNLILESSTLRCLKYACPFNPQKTKNYVCHFASVEHIQI